MPDGDGEVRARPASADGMDEASAEGVTIGNATTEAAAGGGETAGTSVRSCEVMDRDELVAIELRTR